MNTFIGVDLGWYGKPSGLASLRLKGKVLQLASLARLEHVDEILGWIRNEAGDGNAMVAVDAPLVIPNATGIRPAERELNADYRRFHAGCHAANLGRPFARNVTAFSQRLEAMGFDHGTSVPPMAIGKFQIEVHPHAATVNLFGLDRIVKYKRGVRERRAGELGRLRDLVMSNLPMLDPPLSVQLPALPEKGNLKGVEDRIDAVLCAYIAAHYWRWGTQRNRVYGNASAGYIVVPAIAR